MAGDDKLNPLVSVLMTVYNREKYIAEAIQSVLNSSYKDFELIITDDCSTDQSLAIAKEFAAKDSRIRVYANEVNLGDYPNRNRAASFATGKYLKYVDADDVMYYHELEVMVRFIEKFPEAGFGLGGPMDEGRPFPFLLSPREIYLDSFYHINHFDRAPGSGIIKTAIFRELGGFSGKRMIGDYEFWLKIARYHPMVRVPPDLHWNRIHQEQESKSSYARYNYPRLKKAVLDENLDHPDCPLTAGEIRDVRNHIKKAQRKGKVMDVLARLNHLFK